MKKVILMIALVTISVTNSNAQSTDNRSAVSFGIKAGTNYSNVYDSDNEDFVADGKFGFAAGAFVAIPLGKFIGIQPEILYSQKGFTISSFSGRLQTAGGCRCFWARDCGHPGLRTAFSAGPVFRWMLLQESKRSGYRG